MSAKPSIWIGENSLLIRCAEDWLARGNTIDAVITPADEIRSWAEGKSIPCHPTPRAYGKVSKPPRNAFLWSVTNLDLVPEELLKHAWQAAINFHDGPLPAYAGLNTPVWALVNGESEYGISWHRIIDEIDCGEILESEAITIEGNDTALTLNTKCFEAAYTAYERLLDAIEQDNLSGTPQSGPIAHEYLRRHKPEISVAVDFSEPASTIARKVRALDFGPYANPIGWPRLVLDPQTWLFAQQAEALVDSTEQPDDEPGTIQEISTAGWTITTAESRVRLSELRNPDGQPVCPVEYARLCDIRIGTQLPALDTTSREALQEQAEHYGHDERRWVRRLERLNPTPVPLAETTVHTVESSRTHELSQRTREHWIAAWALWLQHATGATEIHVAARFEDDAAPVALGWRPAFFSPRAELTAGDWKKIVQRELKRLAKRAPLAREIGARHPQLGVLPADRLPVELDLVTGSASVEPRSLGAPLSLRVTENGMATLSIRESIWNEETIRCAAVQLETIADQLNRDDRTLAETNLMNDEERQQVLETWNATSVDYRRDVCIHHIFEERAARYPESPALACRRESINYGELNRRANAVASRLIAAGAGPDRLVAVCVDRSIEMVIAMLGVLKAGAAYIPVDPTYPVERIRLMLEDSGAPWILTRKPVSVRLPKSEAMTFFLEDIESNQAHNTNPEIGVRPGNLAYVIYTSGSTGRPKGVQVEHRNVVNFFIGMDAQIPHDPPGVWLAVTSLSFDISVLELLWTLSRGFKVVLFSDDSRTLKESRTTIPERPIDFSLFYFSADEGESTGHQTGKYHLLLEGAKFADTHGFSAVWTPERHFHAFGGLYPNPAVTGSAIAAVTKNVQIRSGSCVLPLHHPIRVAEDWSVVDNISDGRVGLSFASGWQPNDFVLMKENHARAKEIMVENISVVRKLWRGDKVTFPGPKGDVEVQTLPRPVQPELPFWVTAAGNPETFRIAGEQGANMLTHLLGQSIDELADKIRVYREAWEKAGHSGKGIVSLMLHTFVAPDEKTVRDAVKGPLKAYLKSAAGLIAKYASSFPTFKNLPQGADSADIDFQSMTDEDVNALLDHSVARYYETSGLFGTPEQCVSFVDRLKKIDVNDVACLIDFGVPSGLVLEHLPSLAHLRELCAAVERSEEDGEDFALAGEIKRHNVTHMQCTPSMATMFTHDKPSREGLRNLDHWMIGGEAFPADLVEHWLKEPKRPRILNMYGPTETTIWSTVETIERAEAFVSIGKPIANTQVYILDSQGRPLPSGVPGELFIGGDGVVRGYNDRPDLTAERFIADPFTPHNDGEIPRMYRTGDLAQWLPDGRIRCLGRVDQQVKIRGYRIELGEIETALRAHEAVAEAAVVLREDKPGDKRLVAYITHPLGHSIDGIGGPDGIEAHLRRNLPEFMVPAHLLSLDRLPLTPNRKIDRNALPSPTDLIARKSRAAKTPPGNETETIIADIWKSTLQIPEVGIEDNFFDLGGHSLLTVQVLARLREQTTGSVQMTDLFRFPTIRSLAVFLADGEQPSATTAKAADRGANRRARMSRRRRSV